MAVCTVDDDEEAWLRAGQTMSALWLGATRSGLGMTPASQVVEVESTRRLLQDDVLAGLLRPQVLLRVGWPADVPGNPATVTPRGGRSRTSSGRDRLRSATRRGTAPVSVHTPRIRR